MWENNGRKGRARPQEGGHTIQHRHMWETMGHKRRQGETRPREGERSTHKGKQCATRRDKTSGRRTHFPMGDKRRQDLGKAKKSIQRRHTCGKTRRQGQTRPREGGHISQRRQTCGESREDKTSGRRTHQPTQAPVWGDNVRQGETRPREGGRTIQDRHTCVETMGDKGRQDLGKADTASNGHTCGKTMGDKGRQDLGKANSSANTGRHVGSQGKTRRREGGRNIQHRHTCGETMGDKEGKTSGRRTHHPTQAHM